MISRYLIVCVSLTSALVTCQISKEGYVGINFGGQIGGSSAGNIAKSYEKAAYIDGEASHSGQVAGNAAGAISVDIPAPSVQSSLYLEKNIQKIKPAVVVEKESPVAVVTEKEVVASPVQPAQQNVYVTKYRTRRPHRKHYAYVDANAEVYAPPPPRVSFLTKLFSLNTAPLPPVAPVHAGPAPASSEIYVEKNYEKGVEAPQHTVQTTYTAQANVNNNGQLFNDIFNIPISTLQAVNRLVNNVVGGVSLNKQVNTYATKNVGATAEIHTNANANSHTNGNLHTNSNSNAYFNAEGHVNA